MSWWRLRDHRLQGAVVVTPLLFLGCEVGAGAPWQAWLVVVATALAVWSAARPDSVAGSAETAVLGGSWLFSVPSRSGPPSAWVVGAAVSLLAFHLLVALGSALPGRGVHDASTLRLWATRGSLLAVGAAALWALTAALRVWRVDGGPLGLGAALVLVGAAGWWARRSC